MPVRRTDSPQDDSREQDMLRVFGLRQEVDSSRGDNDAYLDIEQRITQCFELKSSTTSDFVTARDFSLEHIKSWRSKHILTSFYDKGGNTINRSLFVPNIILNKWLDEQEEYIRCEVAIINELSNHPPNELADSVKNILFGNRDQYTLEELQVVLKKQIKKEEYLEFLDIEQNGEKNCSTSNMSRAIIKRTLYLLNRGSSRNNPHFSRSWIKKTIEEDNRLELKHEIGNFSQPKEWLHSLVREYAI